MPSLADLLTPKTQDERESQLLALLNAVGFPVTDWYVGSVGRTIQKMVAAGLFDLDALIPQIAASGFLGPFTIGGKTYPTRGWLELQAREMFGIEPAPATFTRQRCSLWCDPGTGPYDIAAVGQLTALSRATGHRYTNITTGTVPPGTLEPTKVPLDFEAAEAGASYNGDLPGSIIDLVTPLPGLNISNEAQNYGGSPIINAGVDTESDDSIRARCRGRWPSLSDVPTDDRYVAWIRQASIDGGFGITKITAAPSSVVPGYVDIRVATDAGPVPPEAVAALQSYLDARDGIVDHATVATATPVPVTAGGTAKVRRGAAAAARLAAKLSWDEYVASLPIGGSAPEGVVRLAELQQALMDAGALDVSGLTLNGVAGNLALAPTDVALVGNGIDTDLPWVEVA
jgi:hypothetical protein